MSTAPRTRLRGVLVAVLSAGWVLVTLLGTIPAQAHGFSSVVYVDLTSSESEHVRAEVGLEYDLLVVSVADLADDAPFFWEGDGAFQDGDEPAMVAAVRDHRDSVLVYVGDRLLVTAEGQGACVPTLVDDGADGGADDGADDVRIEQREGAPYVVLVLDYACPGPADAHEVTSTLFPDSEDYVRDTKTIVGYDLDLREGSAALDADHPSFSTHQSTGERFWEFFKLGAEHLYGGLDHVLFLLALIAGSRRLREVVLAATTFTLAHSVTFVLAALGLVDVPTSFVEPVIALSIAVVAGWYLWRLLRLGGHAVDLEPADAGLLGLDRAGWTRLGVVFCFGLVHGLGFAGALGIDAAWSWQLLWSLLVFNVGIETVQLALIVAIFPVLALLRRRTPVLALWVTGALAAGVAGMGLVWFVQRSLGI